MKNGLVGNIILDSGSLVELLEGSEAGKLLGSRLLSKDVSGLTGEMNVCELRYLTCREVGWNKSGRVLDLLLASNYIEVHLMSRFVERAAQIKCARGLSLVDCLTLDGGGIQGASALREP